ncbi:TIGR02186 family protein [Desulfosporosinus meridiei]|uniref:Putative transmembrane protein (Alph_Pro_TM) n=1 Tax=Desulfosporosinus meridiei (strain ATCC BAA-275 / DSM 13257 / KCTC 12902 / NCIMB 13706 / S10) TaxID=768704 RepID=J7J3S8_DESMD|nr:TIGR02186 family protein [Desulfosporosinus meridiei]AFQ45631.1 Putative transmembrane protein (Alph_Pro_TM) [Desulfosporosinus meridiei DSM 13257]
MKRLTSIFLGLMLILSFTSQVMADETQLTVSPEKVEVGLRFQGTTLNISGIVPDDAGVYIKVISPNDAILDLSKKGKVSLFWMNVENVSVTKVPKLYQILSSRPLGDLTVDQKKVLGIDQDFSTVYQTAEVTKHTDSGSIRLEKFEAKDFVSSMISIFKKGGLYSLNESAVKVKDDRFETSLELPANIPQEECDVTVYFIKDGKIIGTCSKTFNVETVGIVKWLNNMAIYEGPFYGFMSVMIALVVGSVIAFLFIFIDNRKKARLYAKACS